VGHQSLRLGLIASAWGGAAPVPGTVTRLVSIWWRRGGQQSLTLRLAASPEAEIRGSRTRNNHEACARAGGGRQLRERSSRRLLVDDAHQGASLCVLRGHNKLRGSSVVLANGARCRCAPRKPTYTIVVRSRSSSSLEWLLQTDRLSRPAARVARRTQERGAGASQTAVAVRSAPPRRQRSGALCLRGWRRGRCSCSALLEWTVKERRRIPAWTHGGGGGPNRTRGTRGAVGRRVRRP